MDEAAARAKNNTLTPTAVQLFEAGVVRVMSSADILDELADKAMQQVRSAHTKLIGSEKPNHALVQHFANCMNAARQSAVAKHELFEGKKMKFEGSGLLDFLALAHEPDDEPGADADGTSGTSAPPG